MNEDAKAEKMKKKKDRDRLVRGLGAEFRSISRLF